MQDLYAFLSAGGCIGACYLLIRTSAGSPSSSAPTASRRNPRTLSNCARRRPRPRDAYLFIGTPDVRRREEVVRGSLVMRLVRALPGIDIRIVADRAQAR